MADITNANLKTHNAKDSQLFCYVEGKNLTTKEVGLYIINIVAKENLTDLAKSNFLPYVTGDNWIRTSDGKISGRGTGEGAEPSATFTVTTKDDLNTYNADAKYGVANGLIEAIFRGQTFKHGNDTILVVGTNGTLMQSGEKASRCEMDLDPQYLFYYEASKLFVGQSIDDNGNIVTKANNLRAKSKRECKTVAFELYTLFDSGIEVTTLIPEAYANSVAISEDDSANTISAEFTRTGEVWNANQSLLYGAKYNFAITDLNKHSLEVDYIAQTATGITDVTDFGVSGNTLAVVNSTTGAVLLYTSTGSAWTPEVTGTMVVGCRISSNKHTTSTIALAVSQRCVIAMKTVGAGNTGTGANFAIDSSGVTKNYVCKFFVQDRDAEDFEAFSVVSVC